MSTPLYSQKFGRIPRSVAPDKVGHKVPTFVCIEDKDHTARCVAAIRRRRMSEAQVKSKDGTWH